MIHGGMNPGVAVIATPSLTKQKNDEKKHIISLAIVYCNFL
jgi:hypothetical protein